MKYTPNGDALISSMHRLASTMQQLCTDDAPPWCTDDATAEYRRCSLSTDDALLLFTNDEQVTYAVSSTYTMNAPLSCTDNRDQCRSIRDPTQINCID